MKKLFVTFLILLGICTLTACNKDVASGVDYEAEALYKEMTAKVTLPETMMEQSASVEYFENELGLDFSKFENYVCVRSEDFMKAEVIIIAKMPEAKDKNEQATVDELRKKTKEALEEYAKNQAEVFATYEPEAAKVANKAVVESKGRFVYLIMSEKVSELKQVVNTMIK